MKAPSHPPDIHFSHIGRSIQAPVIVDLMDRALANPELLSLAAGFTDNSVLPRELVGRFAAELTQNRIEDEPLQYGSNQGRIRLRELICAAIAAYPGEQSTAFDPECLLITNGSQQALYLSIQVICDPGDIVLVEEPSYFVCLEMLKGLGLRPIGIPCDDTGAILADEFECLLRTLDRQGERERVKAVYLVSYFGNPSSRSLEFDEKAALAQGLLANGYHIPVIEDAAYRELYFEEPHPTPSIVSIDAFAPLPKLYLGTYTKPFASGLKIGYGYCSHPDWLAKMLSIKGHQDFGSAHFNQSILERVLDTGLYAGYLTTIQQHYAYKAAVMHQALSDGGLRAAGWRWHLPAGGMIFWLRGPAGVDLRMEYAFCQHCIEQGVLYVPGDLCFAAGKPWHCARLATGALPEARLREAVERFVAVARQFDC